MKLISDRMEQALTGLYGLCFTGNSICDNMVTQLDVKFVMPNTSNIIHYHMAHEFPVLADNIAEYASARNSFLHRPAVAANMKEYNTISDMFNELLEFMVALEKEVGRVMDLAISEDDKQTLKNLDKFIRSLVPLTKMALGFVDYVEMNGENPAQNMQMDSNINKFFGIKKHK